MEIDKSKYTIVIPARKGSKGIPFKNRKLIEYTLKTIPETFKKNVIIATDDEEIKKRYSDFKIVNRTEKVSNDVASTKSLMVELSSLIETEQVIMLYLTYPERSWKNVVEATKFYENHSASSLLCKKGIKVSPYLMMFEKGINGEQIIKHDLYRRQDYPKCFEISHFISIFSKKKLDKLNNNLYNKDTIFFQIDDVIDIDVKEDLETYNEKNKNNC